MISALIDFSVRRRFWILGLTLVACAWGLWSFERLPIDAEPDITPVQVTLSAASAGLAPEDLEKRVTYPLETAMSGIPGLLETRSLTKFGLSQVTLVFDDGTNPYTARQLVSERIRSLPPLPAGVSRPELGPITTGLGEIYHYTLQYAPEHRSAGETEDLMDLRTLQEWTIKPLLKQVAGVVDVNTIGGYARQAQIQPDPARMRDAGVALTEIREALAKGNQNAGGNYVLAGDRALVVQAIGTLRNLEDIGNVPIKRRADFRPILVRDVARVSWGSAIRTGAALLNGKEMVMGTVMMLTGENSRNISKSVEKKIEEIRGSLPRDVRLVTLYSRSELVDATLKTVLHNLLFGAALVIAVLFLLLGNLKASLVTSLAIPVTLLCTFGWMHALGISGNLMSLGALDFGVIIDGAVIVIDNCVRGMARRKRDESVADAIGGAAKEIRHSAGFGELMVIAVFVPILGLGGIEGKMFRPMAATFVIALGCALVLSLTFVPALASIVFTGRERDREPWLMRLFDGIYARILSGALRHRRIILGLAFPLLVAGVALFLRLGAEFLPQLDEGSLVFEIVRPTAISLEASIAQEARTHRALLAAGAVDTVYDRIGTADVATDPMGMNESDTYLTLKPEPAWIVNGERAAGKDALTEKLMAVARGAAPDQAISATQPIEMRFNDLNEGTRADLTVKVYGEDLNRIAEVSKSLVELIRKVPGAGDVEPDVRGKMSVMRVEPDWGLLRRFSLSSGPVLDAIRLGLSGEEVGALYSGIVPIPIALRIGDQLRADPRSVGELPVYTADNLDLRLKNVANFRDSAVTAPIFRDNSRRRAAVLINPRGRDVQGFVEEAREKVAASKLVPDGVRLEWTGNYRNLQNAKARLAILCPVALLLLTVMVLAAFGSWSESLLILATIPVALVGGVVGLTIARLPFSITAGIGFIALSGIATLNSVVLMNTFNEMRAAGHRGEALVREAASHRLRPVLMTALVDVFGFIPMALSHGIGAEVQRPVAAVVIGGIFTSTFLTLVLIPSCIAALESRRARTTELAS